MQDFKGIYLGFSPTDESDVLMGEIEITISDKTAKLRMATGLKIEEEEISLDDFETMTTEDNNEIIAITTRSSISVNPAFLDFLMFYLAFKLTDCLLLIIS